MKKYNVEGLMCASCAMSLENALKKHPEIQHATVNFASKTAIIQTNNETIALKIASDLGFELTTRAIYQKSIHIEDITCASCVKNIENVVGTLENVEQIQVSLTSKKAIIRYTHDFEKILQTIQDLGYHTKVKEEKNNLPWIILSGIILFALAMLPMFNIPLPKIIHPHFNPITHYSIQLVLVLWIMFLCKDILTSGYLKLIKKIPNMDSLIFIGVITSFIYSFYEYVLLFKQHTHKMLYFESAGMILVFVTIGKYFENKSKTKSFNAMQQLLEMAPKTAILLDGSEKHIDQIEIGEIIVVKPYQKISLDGTVVHGNSFVDESFLTGESIPKEKTNDSIVYAGTINQNGYLEIKVTKKNEETVLSQMIQFIEQAQNSKAPIARLADFISGYFVWGILLCATVAFLIWWLISKDFNFAMHIMISMLVIACPCALGLATPIAIVVASSKASQHQILFKDASVIEMLSKIDYVIFDKTGTLTENKLFVENFIQYSDTDISTIVKSLESTNEHPLAQTIVDFLKEVSILPVTHFKILPGLGIQGNINNTTYFIGNKKLIEQFQLLMPDIAQYEKMVNNGETVLIVASEVEVLGLIGIKGKIKENALETIEYLNKKNIQSMIVSGDITQSVQAIAKTLQLTNFKAEVLPQDKHLIVEQLKKQGHRVAMVGDGINDAIALASADVGIAIGNGSEIAIENADAILMRSNIFDLVVAIDLSKKTMQNIKQNLFWAFLYNTIGIIIASGILIQFGLMLHPMFAAFAMSFSSVSVVLNSLQLFKYRYKK